MEWSSTVVYYDDLTVGEVTDFDSRPGRMHGHIKITQGDADTIGTTIWFHYNDGVFVNSYGEDVEWGDSTVYDGDSLSWFFANILNNSTVPDWRRLALPKTGNKIVFMLSSNKVGPKAQPWTYDDHFKEVATRAGSSFRIVGENGIIVCSGRYREDTCTIYIHEGRLPLAVEEPMTLEYLEPDDIADVVGNGPSGYSSYIIPGGWEPWYDNEAIVKMAAATKVVLTTEN